MKSIYGMCFLCYNITSQQKQQYLLGFVVSGFCLILEKVTRFELTPTVYCGLLYTYKSISMKTMTKKNYL